MIQNSHLMAANGFAEHSYHKTLFLARKTQKILACHRSIWNQI